MISQKYALCLITFIASLAKDIRQNSIPIDNNHPSLINDILQSNDKFCSTPFSGSLISK